MRKTLLATIDFPPTLGGVASYLKNLAVNLPAEDLFVLAPETPNTKIDQEFKFSIFRRRLFFSLWPKWLPMIWHLWKICRREKIELIWAAQPLPVGTAALILKKFLKVPYFINTHGMDVLGPLKSGGRKLKVLRKVLSEAEFITCNSEYTRGFLVQVGNFQEKIVKILPCADRGEIKDRELKIKNDFSGKKILLSVSRLVERKGQDMVIRALPQVLREVSDLVYVIVGDGNYRENLVKLVQELNLSQQVIFTGAVGREELAGYYHDCDVFIMTAREGPAGDVEGFGSVFLEAGLEGKPVVAGAVGGQAEAVVHSETGLIVDPVNIDEIAEAIIRLMKDGELRKNLGERGRMRAENDFRWEEEAEKLEKMVNKKNI